MSLRSRWSRDIVVDSITSPPQPLIETVVFVFRPSSVNQLVTEAVIDPALLGPGATLMATRRGGLIGNTRAVSDQSDVQADSSVGAPRVSLEEPTPSRLIAITACEQNKKKDGLPRSKGWHLVLEFDQ